MKDPKKFRRDYLKAMRQAVTVYPDAKVEQVDLSRAGWLSGTLRPGVILVSR